MVIRLISLKDCFKDRLLRRTKPSIDLGEKSIKQARFFLKEAEDLLDINKKEMAVIALYNSFFHIARALLFKDGIKERSHFCVARYIEERYVEKGLIDRKFLTYLDILRDVRHQTQYTVNKIEIEEDLGEMCRVSKNFIEAVVSLLR